MVNKPNSCKGCPLYADGRGFVEDEWIPNATVAILAQNPGRDEEAEGRPMVGATGQLQDTTFIPLAGLERGKNVSVANVLKCRMEVGGKKVNDLPKGDILTEAVNHCTQAHLKFPPHVTHVIAQGALALRYATGRDDLSVASWRGHVRKDHNLAGKALYCVEHLASVLRDPKLWWVTELDWRKVEPWLAGNWPKAVPTYLDYTTDTWKEAEHWFEQATLNAPYIALDTEWLGNGSVHKPGYVTLIGLGYKDVKGQVHGIQVDWPNVPGWVRGRFSALLQDLVEDVPLVVQNFAADLPILKRWCGIPYNAYKRIDDTMLAHAVLYSELPHGLEFLASIYGQYPKLKHLSTEDNRLYNWGDVLETISAWEGIRRGLRADKQANGIYEDQSLALIPILLETMEKGIRVNKPRVLKAKPEYEAKANQAIALAQAYLGWPINVGSDDQVKYYLYTEKGYPLQLDPDTKRPAAGQDAIATLREMLGPTVDTQAEPTIEIALARIAQGADPVIEARVLYQKCQHVLDAYIYSLHKRVVNAKDDNEAKRARASIKGLPWTEDSLADRVYPNFAIHAQKTGRWSTTDPPLAQLPKSLRDIICPDPGHVWVHWDWSGIELQLLEVHSGSDILRKAHEEDMDLHTWTTCSMFGYDMPSNLVDPHEAPECQAWRTKYAWKGKDDPRRVFSKQARFECNYGGYGATAADRAVRMGLNKGLVKAALGRLLTADDKYYAWRQRIERIVKETRLLRTFMGRPRKFLGVSKSSRAVPPKVVREALDYQMQGGVSDIFNSTLVLAKRTYPYSLLAWSMHDSQYHSIPREQVTQPTIDGIKSIVRREFNVEGRVKRFPAVFGITYAPGETPLPVRLNDSKEVAIPARLPHSVPRQEGNGPHHEQGHTQ